MSINDSFSLKSFMLSELSHRNSINSCDSLQSVTVEKEDAIVKLTNDEVEKFYTLLGMSFYNRK